MPEPDRLELRDLVVRAGERTVVDGAALELRSGQLMALVGPSGSGKTTLLRALLGMVDVAPGVVSCALALTVGGRTLRPYEGRPGTRRERDRAFGAVRGAIVGWLPQDGGASLTPWARVQRSVAAAARLPDATGAARDPDPLPWLVAAGFASDEVPGVARAYPHELSGGMAERAALAVTLARGSRFLLVDEPTTGLDPLAATRVLRSLRGVADAGRGVLVVTHDGEAVRRCADVVMTLRAGRGTAPASRAGSAP